MQAQVITDAWRRMVDVGWRERPLAKGIVMTLTYLIVAVFLAMLIGAVVFFMRGARGYKLEDDDVPPHRGPTSQSGPDERRG